ncbi:fba40f9f-bf7e-45a9-988d-4d74e4377574 [Sclerotinia trifoliorum]|uniref:Fba40f9f-bf7e-45a9-988d-4d74e4377574 n=1 Tax=Sclerotinia trifoliorum TaxID=28548 RepID=A0A8H2W0X6_9HELO|nr:fba40f9f-bf7e-45a9-988d-4d74e4377574 [Sclerotinia trifoliorum]
MEGSTKHDQGFDRGESMANSFLYCGRSRLIRTNCSKWSSTLVIRFHLTGTKGCIIRIISAEHDRFGQGKKCVCIPAKRRYGRLWSCCCEDGYTVVTRRSVLSYPDESVETGCSLD